MLISSFLQPYTGGLGQSVSCELKRYFHFTFRLGGHDVYFKL